MRPGGCVGDVGREAELLKGGLAVLRQRWPEGPRSGKYLWGLRCREGALRVMSWRTDRPPASLLSLGERLPTKVGSGQTESELMMSGQNVKGEHSATQA